MSEDRKLSLRLDMNNDQSMVIDLEPPAMARLTISVLEDTLRKLRAYAEAGETEKKPPSWWQGSVVNDGEVVAYRWSDLSSDSEE